MSQFNIYSHQECRSEIIDQLRKSGYSRNYKLGTKRFLLCLEDNSCISYDLAVISLVDHVSGDLRGTDYLLFMVETSTGDKGIMALPLGGGKNKYSGSSRAKLMEEFWKAF
ncbi:hypothetical protein [Mucilaginibacter psychrotolerans]|uniref:Uncharacterized protein n=1 Tax=Mucilaginibacter psychrotolerans TaxID=1524096 RepID=A0A4Y8SGW2_9SPHI|nr:hypothetical protein [Mucilaginibacter psychrotolerans]TFF37767.1 hypothetical protein E2R66_11410 [Mucilaginibacter psychrotolerans]